MLSAESSNMCLFAAQSYYATKIKQMFDSLPKYASKVEQLGH